MNLPPRPANKTRTPKVRKSKVQKEENEQKKDSQLRRPSFREVKVGHHSMKLAKKMSGDIKGWAYEMMIAGEIVHPTKRNADVSQIGDMAMYSNEALYDRLALRSNTEIRYSIGTIWAQLPKSRKACISRTTYVTLFQVIAKRLLGLNRSASQLQADWAHDIGTSEPSAVEMNENSFFDAIFEMIDIWESEITVSSYLSMAQCCLRIIRSTGVFKPIWSWSLSTDPDHWNSFSDTQVKQLEDMRSKIGCKVVKRSSPGKHATHWKRFCSMRILYRTDKDCFGIAMAICADVGSRTWFATDSLKLGLLRRYDDPGKLVSPVAVGKSKRPKTAPVVIKKIFIPQRDYVRKQPTFQETGLLPLNFDESYASKQPSEASERSVSTALTVTAQNSLQNIYALQPRVVAEVADASTDLRNREIWTQRFSLAEKKKNISQEEKARQAIMKFPSDLRQVCSTVRTDWQSLSWKQRLSEVKKYNEVAHRIQQEKKLESGDPMPALGLISPFFTSIPELPGVPPPLISHRPATAGNLRYSNDVQVSRKNCPSRSDQPLFRSDKPVAGLLPVCLQPSMDTEGQLTLTSESLEKRKSSSQYYNSVMVDGETETISERSSNAPLKWNSSIVFNFKQQSSDSDSCSQSDYSSLLLIEDQQPNPLEPEIEQIGLTAAISVAVVAVVGYVKKTRCRLSLRGLLEPQQTTTSIPFWKLVNRVPPPSEIVPINPEIFRFDTEVSTLHEILKKQPPLSTNSNQTEAKSAMNEGSSEDGCSDSSDSPASELLGDFLSLRPPATEVSQRCRVLVSALDRRGR